MSSYCFLCLQHLLLQHLCHSEAQTTQRSLQIHLIYCSVITGSCRLCAQLNCFPCRGPAQHLCIINVAVTAGCNCCLGLLVAFCPRAHFILDVLLMTVTQYLLKKPKTTKGKYAGEAFANMLACCHRFKTVESTDSHLM